MPKYIKEGRFGVPKIWKTGSVLDTYPTPIGYIGWDQGGHEITKRPYVVVSIEDWFKICTGQVPPPADITVLDCSFRPEIAFDVNPSPTPEKLTFEKTRDGINALLAGAGIVPKGPNKLPFKTVVADPITELNNSIYRHVAKENTAMLADARKWAGNIGMKTQQVIQYLNALATQNICNVVTLFHTEVQKDELTQKITEVPMVYSQLRHYLGGLYTQFFHQSVFGQTVVLRALAFENVAGIGARWPRIEGMIGPTFKDIYGKEPDVFQ